MKRHWPILLGFLAGLIALAIGLYAGATAQEGWKLAARFTARMSFPFFILTFAASALIRLHPRGWTKALMRDRRWWGLGFGACFLVHLIALTVNNGLRGRFPATNLGDPGFWFYLLILAMALTSTDAARRSLGGAWKLLHRTGMWGLWVNFALAPYFGNMVALEWPDPSPLVDPYTLVCLAAVALKMAAWTRSRLRRLQHHPA